MYQIDIAHGWYCGNPCDSLIAKNYPWGWKETHYDDSGWKLSKWLSNAVTRESGGHADWLMVPRNIELLVDENEQFKRIRRTTGINKKNIPSFFEGKNFEIPPNKKISLLLDMNYVTVGYPEMMVSGGQGSSITMTYAESLYGENKLQGNRDIIKDKKIIGYEDVFLPDGGTKRIFHPTWHRAFRYVKLDIITKDEPLVIHDYHNRFTSYPAQEVAYFRCDDESMHDLWDIYWRTVKICAQDIMMSDAYYETMQYLADTRIHAIVLFAASGDDKLYRNAIQLYDDSRIPDGLTLAAYPNDWHWIIPFFSLVWANMIDDYYMISGDEAFVKPLVKGVRILFNWFEEHMQDNGLLGELEWANPNHPDKNSAFFSMAYAYTLNNIANTWSHIGLTQEAKTYKARAKQIADAAYSLCYSKEKKFIAETPAKEKFTARTQFMAILTDAVPAEMQKELMGSTISQMGQSGCHEQFYFNQALKKAGLGERFIERLEPYRDMLDEGLTTAKENLIEDVRSDCHPWACSPLYYYFNIVCGIEPLEPGYKTVKIAPALGPLNEVNASFPLLQGDIKIDIKRYKKTGITGTIILPENTSGVFNWQGTEIKLSPGKQTVMVE